MLKAMAFTARIGRARTVQAAPLSPCSAMTPRIISVSYTHLDVYKRQDLYPRRELVYRQGQSIFHDACGLSPPHQGDELGIPALPTAKRLDSAEKRCSESVISVNLYLSLIHILLVEEVMEMDCSF